LTSPVALASSASDDQKTRNIVLKYLQYSGTESLNPYASAATGADAIAAAPDSVDASLRRPSTTTPSE
jgi:hypothetical protein